MIICRLRIIYVNNFDMPYGLKCLGLIDFILSLFVFILFIGFLFNVTVYVMHMSLPTRDFVNCFFFVVVVVVVVNKCVQ